MAFLGPHVYTAECCEESGTLLGIHYEGGGWRGRLQTLGIYINWPSS